VYVKTDPRKTMLCVKKKSEKSVFSAQLIL
jgi:hypothetical protein